MRPPSDPPPAACGDSPPFEISPGSPASPVILHVPHASRELTSAARASLIITAAQLADELDNLTDAHTDAIAAAAARAAAVRPWIFRNRWSRLVADPERFPDDREEMLAAGMGAVYTHGYAGRRLRDDDPVRVAAALEVHFHPYAAAFANLVDSVLATAGRAVIVDVHSYATVVLPYELHGAGPRPPVCLGTDDFHTPAALVAAAASAFGEVAVNTPFAGCYVPLRHYRTDARVSALMIEIRRDGYMTEPGGPPTAGLTTVAGRLTKLIDAITA